jgi:hypothetical protein
MFRSFEFFEHGGDIIVIAPWGEPKWTRPYLESAPRLWPPLGCETQLEQFVHHGFVGPAAAPHLGIHERGNIVVDGQCRSHIMMLT